MIFIQFLLIVAFVFVLVYSLQNRNATYLRASRKLLLIAFVVVGMIAVLRPGLLTDIAHLVGVGRGTDLLLYVTVVAFVFVTISIYLKFKDQERKIVELGRHIALQEAKPQSSKDQSKAK